MRGSFGRAVGLLCLAIAQQATTPIQRSYINPFPNGDRYRVLVVGDSLGDGLWSGLYRAFEDDATLEFIQRAPKGFTRPNSYDWNNELADILKKDTYQIAVIMFGDNDAQPIKSGRDWLKVGSEGGARSTESGSRPSSGSSARRTSPFTGWAAHHAQRGPERRRRGVERRLSREGVHQRDKFIETWNGFTDKSGRFSAYGPDMTGQVKRLRADDGIHFTMRGYLKLANYVEKELRRDLDLAKIERNIPLAGNEDEQAKVMGRAVVPGRSDPSLACANQTEGQRMAATFEKAQAGQSPQARKAMSGMSTW